MKLIILVAIGFAFVIATTSISYERPPTDIQDYLNGHENGTILPSDEVEVRVDVIACEPVMDHFQAEVEGYESYLRSDVPLLEGPQTLVLRGIDPIIVVGEA